MNERIRKLAEEADEYADATLSPGEFHPDWHDVRDARFAILIIAECIKQCTRVSVQAKHWDYLRNGPPSREVLDVGDITAAAADTCANLIEQHFGVG